MSWDYWGWDTVGNRGIFSYRRTEAWRGRLDLQIEFNLEPQIRVSSQSKSSVT